MLYPFSESPRHHSNIPDFSEIYGFLRQQPIGQGLERLAFPASLTDEQDTFLFVNQAFCERYGYSARQIIGMTPRLILPINRANDLRDLRRRLVHGATNVTLENIDAHGRRFAISLRALPLVVRLREGVEVQVVFMGVGCRPGEETERDLALMGVSWDQLASTTVVSAPDEPPSKEHTPQLSQREAQIKMLDLVGCDTKHIAHVLGISDSTVRVLRTRIRQKSASTPPMPLPGKIPDE